jgi:hypothetical protein
MIDWEKINYHKNMIKNSILNNEKVTNFSNFISNRTITDFPHMYILNIGKVLFSNTNNNFFPYDIWVDDDYKIFTFKIAFILGDCYYAEYPKKLYNPVIEKDGLIIYGKGNIVELNRNYSYFIEDFKFIEWQTKLPIKKLKEKCCNIDNGITMANFIGESFHDAKGNHINNSKMYLNYSFKISNLGNVLYNNEPLPKQEQKDDLNFKKGYWYVQPKNCPNRLYIHWLVAETFEPPPDRLIYSDIHHLTEEYSNNSRINLLCVSKEQHASIHPFMWNDYEIRYELLVNKYKNY